MQISNKISEYSQVYVPPLISQESPAEQRFVGGVFVLSVCRIGNVAELLYCSGKTASLALLYFWLVFNNRRFWSVGFRCCIRLRILPPSRPHSLPPASSLSKSRIPASASGGDWLVRLVPILRYKLSRRYSTARSAHTSGAGLSLPVIHSPALGSGISTLETSAASTGHWAALCYHIPASEASAGLAYTSALEALVESTWSSTLPTPVESTRPSALTALDVLIRTLAPWAIRAFRSLNIPAESARASTLSGLDILIRSLAPRAIWTRYPGIIRLRGVRICVHLRSSDSWPPSRTAAPSLSATTTTAGLPNRLTSQNRQCQHKNDHCFDSCLIHFRSLSLVFHFSAFLSPESGSFYMDSGAGGKMVTPGEKISGRNISGVVMTRNRFCMLQSFKLRIILWSYNHNAPLSEVRHDFSDVHYRARIIALSFFSGGL